MLPMEWESHGMTPLYRRFLYDRGVERIGIVLGYQQEVYHQPINHTHLAFLTKFGLGQVRSLVQFEAFVGIDLTSKHMVQDRCKELAWVGYDTRKYSDPQVEVGNEWGGGPELLPQGHSNIPLTMIAQEVEAYSLEAYVQLDVADHQEGAYVPDGSTSDQVIASSVVGDATHVNAVVEDPTHVHRGKELWYVFQYIDTTVESIIHRVDQEIGTGHGHKVMKIVLLGFPMVLFILYVAIFVITNGTIPGSNPTSKKARLFNTDLKQI